jgi:hypothetical protein
VTTSSNESPFLLTKELESALNNTLAAIDVYELDAAPRKIATNLRRCITDARLDVRDYELSETRDEQLAHAQEAKKRLHKVRKDILSASEYNIFSSVDVAQLTANIEQIIERLE